MKHSIDVMAEMVFLFHEQLLNRGFKRKEALKLTQTFVYATLHKTTKSKEEN